MDILGVGIPELIFIFIIILMVFGPHRLPEIAAQLGRHIRNLHQMSQSIRGEWQQQFSDAVQMQEKARTDLQKAAQLLPSTTETPPAPEIKPPADNTISVTQSSPTPQVSNHSKTPKETLDG